MTIFNIEVNGQIQQIEDVSNYQKLKQRIYELFPDLNERMQNIYYQFDGDKIQIENQNDFQNMMDGIQDQKISLFIQCEQNQGQPGANRILQFEDENSQKQSIVQGYENNKENDCELRSNNSEREKRMKVDAQFNATCAMSQIKSFEQPTNNLTQSTHNLLIFMQETSLPNDKDNEKEKEQAKLQEQQKVQSQKAIQQKQVDKNYETVYRTLKEVGQIQDIFQEKPNKTQIISNICENNLAHQIDTTQIEEQDRKSSESQMLNVQNSDITPINTQKDENEQEIIYQSELRQDNDMSFQKQDAYVQTTVYQIKKYTCVACGKNQSTIKFYRYMHSCIVCEICNQRWSLLPKSRPFKLEEKI